MFKLYNSLTKKKEPFVSIKPKKVSLYVCGITPYDTTHLGHAFTYVFFDILLRVLKHEGLRVNYTQNVTDINDRDNDILKKAKEENVSWQKVADFWTEKFLHDMSALNWVEPTYYLKVSENVTSMIRIIELLLNKKFAYRVGSSVYLDVSKVSNFGKLSKLKREQMIKIAKDFDEDVENPDKRNPLDFTLWRKTAKNQPPHIPSFDSPFGKGRPGWHIECSAISLQLGDQIDIHGGGIDLIYPHHEAEIAQSESATGKIPFSKFWMHTANVFYKGKKMSKSPNNLVMVSDLLKKYSPNVIRWYLISHHYRQPFEFFESDLEYSSLEFMQIEKYLRSHLPAGKQNNNEHTTDEFINALEDDLDTPLALEIIKQAVQNQGSIVTIRKCLSLLGFLI